MQEKNTQPRSVVRSLIMLNVVLLGLLAAITFGSNAEAQVRKRGDYAMVAGGANGTTSGVVYVVDTINHQLIAVSYDPNSKSLGGVGARDLARDAAQLQSRRRN